MLKNLVDLSSYPRTACDLATTLPSVGTGAAPMYKTAVVSRENENVAELHMSSMPVGMSTAVILTCW